MGVFDEFVEQKGLPDLFAQVGLAVQPTYTPAGGAPFAIDGVFDEAYTEVVIFEDRPPMNSVGPVLGVRLAQFPTPPAQGDKVFIPRANTTFVVANVQPDSHGWALLKLNETKAP